MPIRANEHWIYNLITQGNYALFLCVVRYSMEQDSRHMCRHRTIICSKTALIKKMILQQNPAILESTVDPYHVQKQQSWLKIF